jgi:hypothetical protein
LVKHFTYILKTIKTKLKTKKPTGGGKTTQKLKQLRKEKTMKKVRLFVNKDMTVIDIGQDTYRNFHSFDRDVVIANVVEIIPDRFGDGCTIVTDYRNPYRSVCSRFNLNAENFARVQWVE